MVKRWDILGIGTAAVDDLLFVRQFPRPDEKIPVQTILRQCGGQTATALVTAARQGARTAFFSRLGEDDLSLISVQELEKEGVDCSLVEHTPGSRPFYAVVIVDATTGSRTILFNGEGVFEPEMNTFDPMLISQSHVILIDHNIPKTALRAAQIAHSLGVPVVADLESATIPGLQELLSLTDHLIVSRNFAVNLTKLGEVTEMLFALHDTRRKATVITCGRQGCWYILQDGRACHIPAFPVQVIDSTGCGDVFHGAYAAAIARDIPINQALLLATASAAIKATQPGGRSGIPNLSNVEQFIKENPINIYPYLKSVAE